MTDTRPYYPRIIHVEGMDLAGKSTATRALSELVPASVLSRNAMTPDNVIYELADQLRRKGMISSEVLGHLYVAALLADIDAVREPDTVTIQDSTILLRSLAFNDVIGLDRVVSGLLDLVPRHPRFGVTIVLTATIEARLARLDERSRLAPGEVAPDDLMIVREPEKFLAMETTLVRYAHQFFDPVVIDTSDLTKAQVSAMIAEVCRSIGSAS
jgi:thymidylate kinase